MTDYFYGGQADLFSFYRLPKALFVDPRFRGISAESKILYGLLLDRMGLSVKVVGYTSSSRQKKSWKRSIVRTTRPPSS